MPSIDDMVRADLNATAARRCGDEARAEFWRETAQNISDALERADYEDGHVHPV